MLKVVAQKLRVGLLGATVMLACAGQAQAATFVGDWDPAFGPDFPNLGWRGSAEFYIPDNCLNATPTGTATVTNPIPFVQAGSACLGGERLKLISANVDFYNLSNNSGKFVDDLFFTAPSATIKMQVTDGALSGVVGTFIVPERLTSGIAGVNTTTDFWLSFVQQGAGFYAQLRFVEWGPCAVGTKCDDDLRQLCIVDQGVSQISADPNGQRPFLTFTRIDAMVVPEPGSLALLIPAIGMLGLVRRRKSAA